jgi:hypothetical protein
VFEGEPAKLFKANTPTGRFFGSKEKKPATGTRNAKTKGVISPA